MPKSRIDVNEVTRLRQLGYTQQQIARCLGVTQQAISLILLKAKKKEFEIGVKI